MGGWKGEAGAFKTACAAVTSYNVVDYIPCRREFAANSLATLGARAASDCRHSFGWFSGRFNQFR